MITACEHRQMMAFNYESTKSSISRIITLKTANYPKEGEGTCKPYNYTHWSAIHNQRCIKQTAVIDDMRVAVQLLSRLRILLATFFTLLKRYKKV